ncbi:MAG TPA: hypothetical protein DHW39_09025 [Erysipelotrichaceae bacterium]|nr:hypothetical protein [Erysipelotrichaceae bacterium]
MEEISVWDIGKDIFTDGALLFVLHAVLALLLAYLAVRMMRRLIDKAIARSDKRSMTPFTYLFKIISTVIYGFAVFSILDAIRPLSGLGTAILSAGSVATVIVGLAAQNAFGNLISGFFLAVNQPFHIGDSISLPEKNIAGSVVEITLRHTVLSTYENARVIIPNSVLDTAVIEDRAFGQESFTRRISFSVAYDTDLELMKKVIFDVVLNTEGYIDYRSEEQKKNGEDPFLVRTDDFLDSGILISFPIVCRTFGDSFRIASDIREGILRKFRDNGIEIPYPKVDIVNK